MNCREFENIVNDLARAKMMGAASRAAGMSHAEICERCASRLADECALSAGLESLAASDKGKAAPPGVEATLLKAFRAHSSNSPARPLPVRSKTWLRGALAAAAAILIAFGFIVYRAIQNELRKDDDAHIAETPAPQPVVKGEEQIVKGNGEFESPRESRPSRAHRGNRPRLNKPFIIDSVTAYAKDSEDATDFFPLSYGGDQRPMERGEVIRVEMPNSFLIAFGLPVNVERADIPVKADLILCDDGMVCAMRVVR